MCIRDRARLFQEYFFEGDAAFAKAVFGGDTQIGRSLVRELSLIHISEPTRPY